MADSYDITPYPTSAEARLHPHHLQVCALFNGYSPQPPHSARVLEIGCGNGFNLAPMAEQFPNAYFLGLDRAASAIQFGSTCLQRAGLTNIELRCVDLLDAAHDPHFPHLGQFHYIIAHGFYSWVPEPVREAMWALVRRALAPHGILHLSYNALPGWYGAQAVRDFAQFLAGDDKPLSSVVQPTWDALGALAQYADSGNSFAVEAARIRGLPASVLAHDELGEACQAFYLTGVVRRAKTEGFRYAGEAGSSIPSDLRKHEDVANMVSHLGKGDGVLHQQLIDFTSMRRFHDSLFTWESNKPEPFNLLDSLLSCWARSDIRFLEESASGERAYEYAGGVRITSSHPLFSALADAMQAAAPGAVHLRDFVTQHAQSTGLPESVLSFHIIPLVQSLLDGAVLRLRLEAAPVACLLPPRPFTGKFSRLQAALDSQAPNAYHACVSIAQPWQRALFTLLDGTRDLPQLAETLAFLTWAEIHPDSNALPNRTVSPHATPDPGDGYHLQITDIATSADFTSHPEILQSQSALLDFYSQHIPSTLESFLRDALLLNSHAMDALDNHQ